MPRSSTRVFKSRKGTGFGKKPYLGRKQVPRKGNKKEVTRTPSPCCRTPSPDLVASEFKIALVQMPIGSDKSVNIKTALKYIAQAKNEGAFLVVLPECFNSSYGEDKFSKNAEAIPNGETSQALSKAAKENKIFLVGGSIPERDGTRLYNTATAWGPDGSLLTKHRKIHLFDMDIPGKCAFKESSVFTAGEDPGVFDMGICKVGIAVCYDLRFPELASLYRQKGVDLLLYPGAFDEYTGPLHWEPLLRARAIDNQFYVAGICGARDKSAYYVAYGHTTLIDPWGCVVTKASFDETVLYAQIDLSVADVLKKQIPYYRQRRPEIYEKIAESIK